MLREKRKRKIQSKYRNLDSDKGTRREKKKRAEKRRVRKRIYCMEKEKGQEIKRFMNIMYST